MDIFKSIDWNPSLNDIIDDEFINGERLERESVMYRILRGTFTDPFADIHEDYKDMVTQEDIEAYEKEKEKEREEERIKATEEKGDKKNEEEASASGGKYAKYYPGIVRTEIHFPRASCLTQEQHSACLRVLLHFSAPGKPDVSKINRDDLETYSSLQSSISEEQNEFLKIAKENWTGSRLTLIKEELINRKWKCKMRYVQQLPRYYGEHGTIPFTSDKDIKICFNATLMEKGTIPRLLLPPLTRPVRLFSSSRKAEQRYFTFNEPWREKNLVSEDPNCQRLAETNEIDVVVSSSGLTCLANNLDPSYPNSWTLPVVVKEINERRVVFINKALPPIAKNIMQKNSWLFKYMLKSFVLHPTHKNAVNLDKSRDEEPMEEKSVNLDEQEDTIETDPAQSSEATATRGINFSYNVFTIGSCGLPQNELMKNKVEKDYKILVRTKTDGVEVLGNKQIKYTIVAAKLENQLDLGAEAVTLEEASKQWASLVFRPDTGLIRVRINPTTSEIIQYENRTSISVNNEMKRLYNVKGEDSLLIIYNVADIMTRLGPGSYLIKHTVRNGAFAAIYKETETSGKNAIDLQALYSDEEFPTIPNAPWPLIDKAVALPAHQCFERMPAMFYPSRKKLPINKKKGVKRNPPRAQGKSPRKKKKKRSPKRKGKKSPDKPTAEEPSA